MHSLDASPEALTVNQVVRNFGHHCPVPACIPGFTTALARLPPSVDDRAFEFLQCWTTARGGRRKSSLCGAANSNNDKARSAATAAQTISVMAAQSNALRFA